MCFRILSHHLMGDFVIQIDQKLTNWCLWGRLTVDVECQSRRWNRVRVFADLDGGLQDCLTELVIFDNASQEIRQDPRPVSRDYLSILLCVLDADLVAVEPFVIYGVPLGRQIGKFDRSAIDTRNPPVLATVWTCWLGRPFRSEPFC